MSRYFANFLSQLASFALYIADAGSCDEGGASSSSLTSSSACCAVPTSFVAAAAKELRRLDDADGTSTAAAAAAAAARGDNRRVLLLSFHGGVQAAVRRVAAALGWELDVPDVNEWLGGVCDLTLMAHDGAAGATVDGEVQVGAQYRMSDLRAGCLWRDGGLKARLAPYAMVVVADTAAVPARRAAMALARAMASSAAEGMVEAMRRYVLCADKK